MQYYPPSRVIIKQELCQSGNMKTWMMQKEMGTVVEHLFTKWSNGAQRKEMIQALYGAEGALIGETDVLPIGLCKSMLKLYLTMGEKGEMVLQNGSLMAAAMTDVLKRGPEALWGEMEEWMEGMKEHMGQIAMTKEGSEWIIVLMPRMGAKERKKLLKGMKVEGMTQWGWKVVMHLFYVMDDVKAIEKWMEAVIGEDPWIVRLKQSMISEKWEEEVPQDLVLSMKKTLEKSMEMGTTKKTDKQRREELQSILKA